MFRIILKEPLCGFRAKFQSKDSSLIDVIEEFNKLLITYSSLVNFLYNLNNN